ncbi:hypothetical protein JHN55_06970 [Streptomyces sp. MBT56]|uniref:hypothetical protein n=1 Tax=unclassified Streptomyces TaxID=2593676 RepID=UPI00190BB91E|nr:MULTISPECIES: hypothetical protein [unclassified Streptomyces]MBK3556280.1 hypothetical protein [Streptomyces sp. MBT56]MBK3601254.1 hypothetical protein [Streptomyces sp. MBT54]MBK3614511.1 hypothetical protein [Streptomyces sp. MBT98]MBK6042844.1 hypothetical protein [Streptomyces sp. MBT55]
MTDIDDRMAEAEQAETEGRHLDAAHLYRQLGTDIQTQHGQFDSRALDAFEGMARVISQAGESEGNR